MAMVRCVDESGKVVIPQLDVPLQAGQTVHYQGQDYVVQPGAPKVEQEKSSLGERWCQTFTVRKSGAERSGRGPAVRG